MHIYLSLQTVKKNSFWKEYIETFPRNPTSPVWWKKKQLDALGSEVVKNQVISLQTYVKDEYKALFPYLTKTYPKYFKKKKWTLKVSTAWPITTSTHSLAGTSEVHCPSVWDVGCAAALRDGATPTIPVCRLPSSPDLSY